MLAGKEMSASSHLVAPSHRALTDRDLQAVTELVAADFTGGRSWTMGSGAELASRNPMPSGKGRSVFSVEMLPAQQGDALWIEYSAPQEIHRILIDCGTPPTYQVIRQRIELLDPNDRRFDLLIVTHIDTDHIGGALKLLADRFLGARFGDVWFNDWDCLPPCPDPARGPIDGAIMSKILQGMDVVPNRLLPCGVPELGHGF
jgi:hypothetical protein